MGHLADQNAPGLPAWLRVLIYILAAFLFTFFFSILFLGVLDFEGGRNIYQKLLYNILMLLGFACSYYLFAKYFEGYTSLPNYLKWNFNALLIGLGYGFVLISLCAVIMVLSSVLSFQFNELNPHLPLYFLLMFLVSLGEELAFRVYILNTLSSAYGKIMGVLCSSLLFGLIHWFNDHSTVVGIITLSLFGVLLALLYYRFSSIWLPVGLHLTWNYTQGSVFGFAISGHDSNGILKVSFRSDTPYLSGEGFGMEGSVFLMMITLIVIAVEYQRCRTSSKKDTLRKG